MTTCAIVRVHANCEVTSVPTRRSSDLTGDSAKRMSRLRSHIPLLAFTPESKVRRELALSWGIQTYEVPMVEHSDEMARQVDQTLQANKLADAGDVVVIVSGAPPGTPGSTNSLRVHRIGEDS